MVSRRRDKAKRTKNVNLRTHVRERTKQKRYRNRWGDNLFADVLKHLPKKTEPFFSGFLHFGARRAPPRAPPRAPNVGIQKGIVPTVYQYQEGSSQILKIQKYTNGSSENRTNAKIQIYSWRGTIWPYYFI